MAYAIVKTGGKQYRVEEGQTLLVERLPDDEGATVALEPLLFRGDDAVFDADGLKKVKVEAKIVGHERGAEAARLQVQAQARLQAHDGSPSGAHARSEITEIEGLRWLIRRASAPPATGATPTPQRLGVKVVRRRDRHRRRDHRAPARHPLQARRRRRHRQGRHALRAPPRHGRQFTTGRRGNASSRSRRCYRRVAASLSGADAAGDQRPRLLRQIRAAPALDGAARGRAAPRGSGAVLRPSHRFAARWLRVASADRLDPASSGAQAAS